MNKFLIGCFSILLTAFSLHAFADNGELKLTPKMLNFDYSQNEGDLALDCTPTLEDALAQNWIISCGNAGSAAVRKYRVHLWVTMYARAVQPKQSYEVLYWVSDLSANASAQNNASSTTIWFNFDDSVHLTALDLRLGVENDIASLHMRIDPSAR